MPRTKHLLIVNPVSGKRKGLAIVESVRPIFDKADIELTILITQSHNHAFDIARTYNLEKYQAICIAGGDGTAHQVINGMLSRSDSLELPIGLLPAGTGNSFLHDMQLTNPVAAAQAIIQGNLRYCDLARIKSEDKTIYSFNVIGWGMPADINIRAERLRWSRKQRYNLAAILEILNNRQHHASITLDGQVYKDRWTMVVICNTIHAGNGMKMAPGAKVDDGRLDVMLVKCMGRIKLLRMFTKLFSGTHLPDSDIIFRRVRHFQLETTTKLPLIVDGETVGSSPFSVRVLPQRIRIFN